jgi:hypothetical protein
VSAITNSTGSLANNSLRVEGINASHESATVRGNVIDIDVYCLVLVKDVDIVIYAEDSEDEVEGH